MKILLYNNFPFHHEMFGFALDFCKKFGHGAFVFNPNDYEEYMKVYDILDYKYTTVTNIEPDIYDLIIVLTDSDWSYLPKWVNNKTICINHWYQDRNKYIKNSIPIGPLHSNKYNSTFISQIYPILTKDKKNQFHSIDKIYVSIMGRFIPNDPSYLDFIKNKNVIYNFISKNPPHKKILESKNIKCFTNINALDLCNILSNSHYILVTDTNINHNKCYTISASISYAFSTGCQLIIPKEMNSYLRLKSAIVYDKTDNISLEFPDIDSVYEESETLMNNRNKILNNLLLNNITKIEKNILQVCIKPFNYNKLPPFVIDNITSLNPDYIHMLYNDNKIETLLESYPEVNNKYKNIQNHNPAHKKDLIMMLLLHNFGGIYFDIDQELYHSFDTFIGDATFIGMIPVDKNDGLCLGLIGCSKNNLITNLILEEFLKFDFNDINKYGYATLCKLAGSVLKNFMKVQELKEGYFNISNQNILLLSEITTSGTYESCYGTYNNKKLFKVRYDEYPWDLGKK